MNGPRILAISGGSAPHERALNLPEHREFLAEVTYIGDLGPDHLEGFDAVLVPDRCNQAAVAALAPALLGVAARGGSLVVLGEQPECWLPGTRWTHRPTNYWWWLDPEAPSQVVAADPGHSLFSYMTMPDATWHHHGVLAPPPGAETVIAARDGGSVFTVDRHSTEGVVVATTLDPVFHVGSHFMPAAARFLPRLLRWMYETLPVPRG